MMMHDEQRKRAGGDAAGRERPGAAVGEVAVPAVELARVRLPAVGCCEVVLPGTAERIVGEAMRLRGPMGGGVGVGGGMATRNTYGVGNGSPRFFGKE